MQTNDHKREFEENERVRRDRGAHCDSMNLLMERVTVDRVGTLIAATI